MIDFCRDPKPYLCLGLLGELQRLSIEELTTLILSYVKESEKSIATINDARYNTLRQKLAASEMLIFTSPHKGIALFVLLLYTLLTTDTVAKKEHIQ